MDGTVLDIFESGSEPDERAVSYCDPLMKTEESSVDSHEEVQARLADLGYLE